MSLILLSLLTANPQISWIMSCSQYREMVETLYADEFFSQPKNHYQRQAIHDKFKRHTPRECYEEFEA